ncbi:MAG TPA: hypothetical protein ENG87_05755 [Candidatus Pacearchaeota archaeon]|nr:septum site-determining protein MinD [archaeon BMS3Abin17]HDK42860.1 hypothetical protein [Candidatus Pacearchaeota archaeon]HDZ61114.1 hypothetical protein [Candidatus Pacearchaeota archaeon]
MGDSIGIMSLKGGVGKTTLVSSLGSAISDFNRRVLLVDANFSAPNLGLHLNIVDPEVTLHHVMTDVAHIKDSIHNLDKFDVIPSSIFHKMNISPLKLKDKIKNTKKRYDYILIDSSPALNEETLAAMLASDKILIVTTPDHPTMSTTLKAIKLANQRGTEIDGLIINKVHNKNFELSTDDIEDTTGVPVMAVIPHDVNMLRALSEFTPSTDYKPKSEGSVEIKKLAATLIGEKYKPKRFKDIFSKITPKRHEINREIYYHNVFK